MIEILNLIRNKYTLTIVFGLLIITLVCFRQKRLVGLQEMIHLFLVGGLFYGGISALSFGVTGSFLLGEDLQDSRILVALSGTVFLWLTYDLVKSHLKQEVAGSQSTNSEKKGVKKDQK